MATQAMNRNSVLRKAIIALNLVSFASLSVSLTAPNALAQSAPSLQSSGVLDRQLMDYLESHKSSPMSESQSPIEGLRLEKKLARDAGLAGEALLNERNGNTYYEKSTVGKKITEASNAAYLASFLAPEMAWLRSLGYTVIATRPEVFNQKLMKLGAIYYWHPEYREAIWALFEYMESHSNGRTGKSWDHAIAQAEQVSFYVMGAIFVINLGLELREGPAGLKNLPGRLGPSKSSQAVGRFFSETWEKTLESVRQSRLPVGERWSMLPGSENSTQYLERLAAKATSGSEQAAEKEGAAVIAKAEEYERKLKILVQRQQNIAAIAETDPQRAAKMHAALANELYQAEGVTPGRALFGWIAKLVIPAMGGASVLPYYWNVLSAPEKFSPTEMLKPYQEAAVVKLETRLKYLTDLVHSLETGESPATPRSAAEASRAIQALVKEYMDCEGQYIQLLRSAKATPTSGTYFGKHYWDAALNPHQKALIAEFLKRDAGSNQDMAKILAEVDRQAAQAGVESHTNVNLNFGILTDGVNDAKSALSSLGKAWTQQYGDRILGDTSEQKREVRK